MQIKIVFRCSLALCLNIFYSNLVKLLRSVYYENALTNLQIVILSKKASLSSPSLFSPPEQLRRAVELGTREQS